MSSNLLFVLQVLVILALPFTLWRFGRLSSMVPWVVIQILAGIALGPSGLGRWFPGIYSQLFTPASLANITGIASIAVLFFGFTAGLHLDENSYRGRGWNFALVGAGSVLVPTILGAAAGLWIHGRFPADAGPDIGVWQFMLAVGIAAGVTALPVLGAILSEMRLMHERIGQWALGLAAVNDAALWILLSALLANTGQTENRGLSVFAILTLFAGYVAAMLWIVRPVLRRLFGGRRSVAPLGDGALIGVVTVAVGSAALTEAIGLHYILGAFVAGAVMPRELRILVIDRIETVILVLLMPFFFMSTGLRTLIDFNSNAFVQIFLAVTAAAIVGKVAGTAIPARLMGESWRNALALGTLMQTKGLMEVIVLTILRDAQLINDTVYSALIAMAVLSTACAMPLTRLVMRNPRSKASAQAGPAD